MSNPRPNQSFRLVLTILMAGLWLVTAAPASAQVAALVSPGPLSKAHSQLDGIANCQKCHEPGRKIATDKCLACHKPIADRIAAKKGVHRNVAGACEGCHAEHAGAHAELRPFDPRRFNHAAETGFALDGRHAPLAQTCARCHKARSFLNTRAACVACHEDVHKGTLGPNCTTCHTTATPFVDARQQFDHSKAKFALTGAHRTVNCTKCHVNRVFTGLKFASCTDCHREPHRQTFGTDCTSCHSTETWKTRKLDHARTGFPLKGAHFAAQCTACHTKPPVQVRLQAGKCSACHADVHRGQFKQDCGSCHTETTFRKAPFDHAAATKFPLTGRHSAIACSRCHKGAATAGPARTLGPAGTVAVVFKGASTSCTSCHEDVHRGSTGQACESCHTTTDFHGLKSYAHGAALTPFFTGRHVTSDCRVCHGRSTIAVAAQTTPAVAAWTFKGLGTACTKCHADPHNNEMAGPCERCHAIDEVGFAASKFSHGSTNFPLTGRHQAVRCNQCHTPRTTAVTRDSTTPRQSPARDEAGRALQFTAKGTDCASCHQDVHLGQVGRQCQTCHSTEKFSVQKYTHKQVPGTLFTGMHSTLACRACHKIETASFPSGRGTAVRLVGSGSACASCHRAQDPHRDALGDTCERCHTPERWLSVSRAFHKVGPFPLEGRHLTVACASCHVNGITKGTPTKCFDCHWVRRQDDPYQTRLGNQCETCHRPTSWTAVNWNHAARTGFALNVSHRSLACDSCHKDRRFTGTGVNCATCHLETYQRTSAPNHAAAGFPTNCEVCHQPANTSWKQAVFNHNGFPLVGLHASQACASCHKNNVYKGTPRDCVGCHLTDYQKTANPNHAASGFPTACEQCHQPTSSTWTGGAFNHANFFPLVGLHATQACASCHKNNVYKGTARDCVGCHLTDYQKTANPNHAAAGFPTACEQCHQATSSTWTGGAFNHANFFQLVGLHATQACASCHKNDVYKGTPRDCVGCHLTNYQQTTNPNHAAAGFPTTCDQCHQATASTWASSFNHSQFFPLLGRHLQQTCSACHKNNGFKGTPTACVACHLTNYQQTTNPNHTAAGFPTTCEACHKASDAAWTQGVFNHTSFPITSGRHAGLTCSTCHTATNNFAVFSCTTSCHPRATIDSHHAQRTGYRYDSAACYACHPSGRAGSPRP